MGQDDVLDFLEKKRKKTNKWFEIKDIKNALRENGATNGVLKNVANNLYKLCLYNLIEFKGVGLWKHFKLFRARKKKCEIRETH